MTGCAGCRRQRTRGWVKVWEHSSFSVNRSFSQICQNCIREKISAKSSQFPLSPKSIEHDFIRTIKVLVFQAMRSSTVVWHERQEVSSTVSPRFKGSRPVRGKFCSYNSDRSDRMIYLRKNSTMNPGASI